MQKRKQRYCTPAGVLLSEYGDVKHQDWNFETQTETEVSSTLDREPKVSTTKVWTPKVCSPKLRRKKGQPGYTYRTTTKGILTMRRWIYQTKEQVLPMVRLY